MRPTVLQHTPSVDLMINDVAIRLGLAPFHGGTSYSLDSDYGVIAQRLAHNIRTTASRGWWFNTWRDYEVTPESWDGSLREYVLPYFVLGFEIPRFQEVPHALLLVNRRDQDGFSLPPTLSIGDGDEPFHTTFRLDLKFLSTTIGDSLPWQFSEFIVVKTANQLANVYGIPPSPESESQAWHALLQADAMSKPVMNAVDDNPITWNTVRRT